MRNHWKNGSLVIEASVLYPIYFFMICIVCTIGIALYKEIDAQSEEKKASGMWAVKEFYEYQLLKEVWSDISND